MRSTAVASRNTRPTPDSASEPRWTRCQGCADPSTALDLANRYNYRYAGITGSYRRDTVALGVARRLGDSRALGVSLGGKEISSSGGSARVIHATCGGRSNRRGASFAG